MHPDAFKRSSGQEPPQGSPERPSLDLSGAHFSRFLVVACVGLFVVELLLALAAGKSLGGLLLGWRGQFWPLYGPWVAEGKWWLIPGSIFEHGGVVHLFFNLSLVWNLGRLYEVGIKTHRLLLVSVAGTLGASLVVLLFAFTQPTVGASGMLLGWLGAMLPIATREHREFLVGALVQIGLISLLPFVSWQGHLGGFLAGAAAGGLLWLGPTWFRYGMPVWITVLALANVWAAQRGASLLLGLAAP